MRLRQSLHFYLHDEKFVFGSIIVYSGNGLIAGKACEELRNGGIAVQPHPEARRETKRENLAYKPNRSQPRQ